MVERRIVRMMVACGIDEAVAKKANRNLDIDMSEVRRRCRACPEPETCERFLGGEAGPVVMAVTTINPRWGRQPYNLEAAPFFQAI